MDYEPAKRARAEENETFFVLSGKLGKRVLFAGTNGLGRLGPDPLQNYFQLISFTVIRHSLYFSLL